MLGTISAGPVAFADDDDDDDDDKKQKKNKVFTGDGPPPKKLGKIGDGYIDNTSENCDFYKKTGKKTWEFVEGLCVDTGAGPPGPPGMDGADGAPGFFNTYSVVGQQIFLFPGAPPTAPISVGCSAFDAALSGGWVIVGGASDTRQLLVLISTIGNANVQNHNTWQFVFQNIGSEVFQVWPRVLCADLTP